MKGVPEDAGILGAEVEAVGAVADLVLGLIEQALEDGGHDFEGVLLDGRKGREVGFAQEAQLADVEIEGHGFKLLLRWKGVGERKARRRSGGARRSR
ncbi:hypothetical protein D3C86_1633380 [compost metagenome]